MRRGVLAVVLVLAVGIINSGEAKSTSSHQVPAAAGAGVYLKTPSAAASDPAATGSGRAQSKSKQPTEAQLDAAQEMAHASRQATFSTPLMKWKKPRQPKAKAKAKLKPAPKRKTPKMTIKTAAIKVPLVIKRLMKNSPRRSGERKRLIHRVMKKRKPSKTSSRKPCDGLHCRKQGDAMIKKVLQRKKKPCSKAKLVAKILKQKACKKGMPCHKNSVAGAIKSSAAGKKAIQRVMATTSAHGTGDKLIRRVLKRKPCKKGAGAPCSQPRPTRASIVKRLLRRSKARLIRRVLKKKKKMMMHKHKKAAVGL